MVDNKADSMSEKEAQHRELISDINAGVAKADHDSRMATAALEMVEGVELVVTGGNIEAMAVKVAKVKGWLAMFINEKPEVFKCGHERCPGHATEAQYCT